VGTPGEGPHDFENREADTEQFEVTGQTGIAPKTLLFGYGR
jgi:hypothetical protein